MLDEGLECCLPWCGAPEGKPALQPASPNSESPQTLSNTPSQLQDIAEEESDVLLGEEDEEQDTHQPLGGRLSFKRRTNVQSPSPTFSVKASKKNQRARASVTSTTSSEASTAGSSSTTRMQAEQGSIADLHKHHNRYLRNRRHTLANVRASVTSTTSSEASTAGSSSTTRMQAEQGSIADLHKHHNRYLRNRRHTLANVR
ncbi:hypothetical protein JTB14_023479 [Gonioctena quinquepunctata]|nr:hypothetical protein JTB14_023479 [Gonioctena quinquepunctata]